ncbi:MAG: putative proteasome-type protease [Ascidiaceihabitans sp.]
MQVYEKDSFKTSNKPRIKVGDPYFEAMSSSWGEALRNALTQLPSYKTTDR